MMMMKKMPVAPASRKAPPAADALPFTPGQIIGSVPFSAIKGETELTETELALLRRGGYRDGDPVPDLSDTAAGRKLRAQAGDVAARAADTAGLTPIDPTTPPLAVKQPRNIQDLAPDEAMQAMSAFREMGELQKRMEQARQEAAANAAAEEIPEHMAAIPGYLAAMATTDKAPSVELVDDIGLSAGAPRPRLKKKVPIAPPAPEPETAETQAGADLRDFRVVCPRCGHDLNTELITPSLEDKVGYIALVMGEQKRFRKTVSLFGGRITITFRSLLTSEENLAFTQVDADAGAGKFSNLILYTATLEDYKMLMCIERVQRKGKPAVEIAPIAEYEYDKDAHKTALPEFKEWLDDEVLAAASVRNAVCRQYWEFTQIQKYLEAKAPDDPFFNGIG